MQSDVATACCFLPHCLCQRTALVCYPPCMVQVVEAVAEELQARGLVRLVVDPVLVSTSGDALATAGALRNAAATGIEGRGGCSGWWEELGAGASGGLAAAGELQGAVFKRHRRSLLAACAGPHAVLLPIQRPLWFRCCSACVAAGALKQRLLPQSSAASPLHTALLTPASTPLCFAGVADALKQHLLPLATVVTPNIPEACKLLGGENDRRSTAMPHSCVVGWAANAAAAAAAGIGIVLQLQPQCPALAVGAVHVQVSPSLSPSLPPSFLFPACRWTQYHRCGKHAGGG